MCWGYSNSLKQKFLENVCSIHPPSAAKLCFNFKHLSKMQVQNNTVQKYGYIPTYPMKIWKKTTLTCLWRYIFWKPFLFYSSSALTMFLAIFGHFLAISTLLLLCLIVNHFQWIFFVFRTKVPIKYHGRI